MTRKMNGERPNIVLLMTDQQRFDQVGYASDGSYETPHLDAIARSGVIFDNAYSSATVCVPARVSLLTGLLHHRVPTQVNRLALREGFWTLPHALRAAGYETALFGKMHFFPMYAAHGFETMRLCEHLTAGYGPDDRDDYSRWFASQQPEDSRERDPEGNARAARAFGNVVPFPYQERFHPTHWVAREASEFLDRRDPRRPLFLVVSFPHPHEPHDPPEPYASLYDASQTPFPADGFEANVGLPAIVQAIRPVPKFKPHRVDTMPVAVVRRILTYMRALVKQIDDAIGRLLTKLNLDETVVFFTSDHGEYAGHRGLLGKFPWVSFDDLARVPFLCTGPAVQGGRRVAELVQSFDFATTALDYAGVDISGFDLDGRSLRPYLEGIVPELDAGRVVFCGTSMGWPAARKGMLKYLVSRHPRAGMLFDLERDPGETTDVSAQSAYDREGAHLRAFLASCLKKTVPVLPSFG